MYLQSNKMRIIVQIKFGSHLYGTATPASDLDIKGVYTPTARDILLQEVRPAISLQKPKAYGEKNTSQDVDYELYSPRKFLDLLAAGQMIALEMLFAPADAMMTPPLNEWNAIKQLAPQILTKKAAAFVHYCQQQANKYGVKGLHIAAARIALKCLTEAESKYGSTAKLTVIADQLKELVKTNKFLSINEVTVTTGDKLLYFEVCGKKALFNASIKLARCMVEGLIANYGARALAAERNKGIDWKALSHAVRIGYEAIEFLNTGIITLPRPEAKYLINIKLGKIPFQQVSEEIVQLLLDVEAAATHSKLPDSFDQALIEDFILQLHREAVFMEAR